MDRKVNAVYSYLADCGILPRHMLRPRNVAPICAVRLNCQLPLNKAERLSTIRTFYDVNLSKNILYSAWEDPAPKNTVADIKRIEGVCYVYFIEQDCTGFVKIGVTRNILARLAALQTSSPLTLSCFKLLEFPSREEAFKTEKSLHRRYGHFRMEGEWFRPDVKREESSQL
jgi:hypothetical protein